MTGELAVVNLYARGDRVPQVVRIASSVVLVFLIRRLSPHPTTVTHDGV